MTPAQIAALTNEALVTALRRLVGSERASTAQVVAHLAELEARGIYLSAGYSSLFAYCRGELHLSEHEAYHRIHAARVVRGLPLVLEWLSDGRINLTTVRLLGQHLTEANHRELLAAATHRTKEEVEELLARAFPRPDVEPRVRKLPGPSAEAARSAGPMLLTAPPAPTQSLPAPPAPPAPAPPAPAPPAPAPPGAPRRSLVSPLSADRYEMRCTIGKDTRDKLRDIRDLLRHAVPGGDLAEIVDRAFTLLRAELLRKKAGVGTRPRRDPPPPRPESRHLAALVRRPVWIRDGGGCAFVSEDGRRCGERAFVEFHHVTPYGANGEGTADNISLRCRAHNEYEAELYYGPIRDALLEQLDRPITESAGPGG
jgi:hypothetical protein